MEHIADVCQAQQLHHAVVLRPVRELQIARRGFAKIVNLQKQRLPSLTQAHLLQSCKLLAIMYSAFTITGC